ncbi:hypothetical protein KFK09_007123 [Dendrobium nobile]|uniref:Reverse transcriptase domain-containing protein n=1 Tax=Dendrobium nobile TaxID=94219 RepID=A0A8T3BTH1_DENNO|nr:hypothetical protein KFK09_007123 [Dendrobium nobile]
MERWSPTFDPYSFKGIFAPVWIRFLCLSLYCWDEENLVRIASRFGSLIKPDAGKGVVKRTTSEANPSVIKSEYGPWIHVQFKNKRFTKERAAGRRVNDYNGSRSESMGNNNQKVNMHKQIQIEKEVTVAVDNSGLTSENWPGGEKAVKDKMPEISINNRYAVLLEASEEESLEKPEEIDKLKDTGVAVADPGIMNNGTICHSGVSKTKLAKELKSLGPLEPGYKKKKRDGRRNSMSGEGSPTMGPRKKEASLYLKEIARDQDIFFIGLMETKMTSIDRRDVDCLIGNDWEYFLYPFVGLSGGALVLWNKKIVTFVVKETSSQVILGDLSVPSLGSWKEEKRGGKRFLFSKGPIDMKCFMTNSDIHDVRCIGPRFTWCNNKEGASQISERLDRCLVNSVALQKLPLALTRHLARVALDHSPIVFKLEERVRFNLKTIKFEDTWRSYPAARSIVYHSWKKNDFGDEYVKFSIIINVKNSKWINAQSEFRHGCPLSPYLFIMCSQLMSNSLKQTGQTFGIKVSPRGPRITHLLYADDVLIFSHVSMALATALKAIVEDFCKWTGQRINVSKSQIIFGKVVRYPIEKKIARVIGFKVVKEMSYLGIKMSLNRLKMADFQEVLSNVMDRLNAWGKKSLSMGGTKKVNILESWEAHASWCPPPKDLMKINVDPSLLSSNLAGIGGIFRDHKGRFIIAFGKNKVHWDIAQLELEAVFSVRE